MKFKRLLSAICAFSALSVQTAQAQLIDTYACERCDEASAITLAKSKAPALNCSLNTAPGQIPTIEDQICTATQKTLIVANPQTRLAFKFNVHSEPDGAYQQMVTVNPVALSPVEQELLATFYNLHQEFSQAVQQFSSLNQSSSAFNSQNLTTFTEEKQQFYSTTAAECDSHPTSYLTSTMKQLNLENTMRAQILANMNGQTWKNYSASHSSNTVNLTSGRGGLKLSFQNDGEKFYVRKVWDINNVFTFAASYEGDFDVNGTKSLEVVFSLNKELSRVDGIPLSYLLAENVGLKDTKLSNCMVEYIKSIQQYSSVIGGSGPTQPGRQPGGSAGAGGLCNHNVKAYACTPWSCREQIFITLRPCN